MSIQKTYFTDAETVPMWENYDQVPDNWKKCFEKKFKVDIENATKDTKIEDDHLDKVWKAKAALYPEYGKIVCLSLGFVSPQNELKIVSFVDEKERDLLTKFSDAISNGGPSFICAHNGKGFDYPYIAKRMIMNGVPVPIILRMMGKKPWDMAGLLDTQELWGMGVFNAHVSLDILAACFGIASPKLDMDGSKVAEVYYDPARPRTQRLADIGYYCEGDVSTLAQVYIRMTGQQPFSKITRSMGG